MKNERRISRLTSRTGETCCITFIHHSSLVTTSCVVCCVSSVAFDCYRLLSNGRDALRRVRLRNNDVPFVETDRIYDCMVTENPERGSTVTDGGERSVTPGGTTNIPQALKGRQNTLPPLVMPRRFPSPFQGLPITSQGGEAALPRSGDDGDNGDNGDDGLADSRASPMRRVACHLSCVIGSFRLLSNAIEREGRAPSRPPRNDDVPFVSVVPVVSYGEAPKPPNHLTT